MDQAPSLGDPTNSESAAKFSGSVGVYTLTLSVTDFSANPELCNKGLVATSTPGCVVFQCRPDVQATPKQSQWWQFSRVRSLAFHINTELISFFNLLTKLTSAMDKQFRDLQLQQMDALLCSWKSAQALDCEVQYALGPQT